MTRRGVLKGERGRWWQFWQHGRDRLSRWKYGGWSKGDEKRSKVGFPYEFPMHPHPIPLHPKHPKHPLVLLHSLPPSTLFCLDEILGPGFRVIGLLRTAIGLNAISVCDSFRTPLWSPVLIGRDIKVPEHTMEPESRSEADGKLVLTFRVFVLTSQRIEMEIMFIWQCQNFRHIRISPKYSLV